MLNSWWLCWLIYDSEVVKLINITIRINFSFLHVLKPLICVGEKPSHLVFIGGHFTCSGFELRQPIISVLLLFFFYFSLDVRGQFSDITQARTNLCLLHKHLSSIRKFTALTIHAFLHIQKGQICHFPCVCSVYTYSDLNSLGFVAGWT